METPLLCQSRDQIDQGSGARWVEHCALSQQALKYRFLSLHSHPTKGTFRDRYIWRVPTLKVSPSGSSEKMARDAGYSTRIRSHCSYKGSKDRVGLDT